MATRALAVPDARAIPPEKRERVIGDVLTALSEGLPLYKFLRSRDDLVDITTFYDWLQKDEGLAQKVGRAREHGATRYLEEAVVTAKTKDLVTRKRTAKDGSVEEWQEDDVQHRKLVVDTLFKAAAMHAPRKYGAKVDVTSGGEKIETAQPVLVDARMQSLIQIAMNRKQTGVTAIEDLGFD